MENLGDVLRHLVNVSHFRSEEDRAKAHAIINEVEDKPEDIPDSEPDVAVRQPEILSPDGSQRWNGTAWEPVPQPENPPQNQ